MKRKSLKAIHQTYRPKQTARQAKLIIKHEQLINDLNQPTDTATYAKALKIANRKQHFQNLSAFGKWLIVNILWCIPPYLVYGQHNLLLNEAILTPKMTARTLFAVQQKLNFESGAFIVVALICGGYIVFKHGTFKRPYQKHAYAEFLKQQGGDHHVQKP